MTTKHHFHRFAQLLQAEGAREALAYIVSLSDYRFIGIFRFHAGKATAAIHFDKLDRAELRSAEVPDNATYCCYVRDSRGTFVTANALEDPRLVDHPAREAVLAYCGVPLLTPEGELLGTLCHYDTVPRDPEQLDIELLVEVASALAHGNHVPPYPVALTG